MVDYKRTWSQFKALAVLKQFNVQYIDADDSYLIWAVEDIDRYVCIIDKEDPVSSDQEDFEDNYKSKCNKPSVSRNTAFHSERGDSFHDGGVVTDIDAVGYETIVSRVAGTVRPSYITDMKVSADQDGIWRVKVNGNVVCQTFYAARDYANCARSLPFKLPCSSTMEVIYKPDSSTANACASIGGYEA